MAGDGAGTPTGLMLKSVLMAASWCRVPLNENQIPIQTQGQYCS
jgi:hypothetical protein